MNMILIYFLKCFIVEFFFMIVYLCIKVSLLNENIFILYRLKEYCERLMFYNLVDYGRKVEEVLWRKVFYDLI